MATECASQLLLERLLNLTHPEVEVVLTTHKKLRGIIIGFFFGRPEWGEPYVLKWHLVATQDLYTFGKGVLNTPIGTIFYHHELVSIRFIFDNAQINFQ